MDIELPPEIRVVNNPQPVGQRTIDRIKVDAPPLIRVYRFASWLVLGIVAVVNLVAFNAAGGQDWWIWLPTGIAVAWLSGVYLVTDFMSDVYRCRRLLEEIAKK